MSDSGFEDIILRKLWTNSHESKLEISAIEARVADISVALSGYVDEICNSIEDYVRKNSGNELHNDPSMVGIRQAAARGSVESVLHILRLGLSPREIDPPPTALEYARRLAQRGLPISNMRGYGIGPAVFLEWAFAIILQDPDARDLAASQKISLMVCQYVEEMYSKIVESYQFERELWLTNTHSGKIAVVRDLLNRKEYLSNEQRGEFESVLGYRFGETSIGLVAWRHDVKDDVPQSNKLELFASELSSIVSARNCLVVPWDMGTVWIWLSGRELSPPSLDVIAVAAKRSGVSVRAASGLPGRGVDGFRDTHDQALQAQEVALAAEGGAPLLTLYGEVGALALLRSDSERSSHWVRQVLGRLAEPTKSGTVLRETLRVFLNTGGSYTETAARLHIHPNTVKYRVSRAREQLGSRLETERLDIEPCRV